MSNFRKQDEAWADLDREADEARREFQALRDKPFVEPPAPKKILRAPPPRGTPIPNVPPFYIGQSLKGK